MATSLNPALDKLMQELLQLARSESDKEIKLSMIDRVLKWEAHKLKAQQGAMGGGFDDPADA